MNSCVLMAKVVRSPELRYTPDQLAVANMLVEFEAINPNDQPQTVRAVGWGNLAVEINEKYKEGDEIVIEGRLAMNTIDRQEGFKEKRAELVISRIFGISGTSSSSNYNSSSNSSVNNTSSSASNVIPFQTNANPTVSQKPQSVINNPDDHESGDEDLDDIPF